MADPDLDSLHARTVGLPLGAGSANNTAAPTWGKYIAKPHLTDAQFS